MQKRAPAKSRSVRYAVGALLGGVGLYFAYVALFADTAPGNGSCAAAPKGSYKVVKLNGHPGIGMFAFSTPGAMIQEVCPPLHVRMSACACACARGPCLIHAMHM